MDYFTMLKQGQGEEDLAAAGGLMPRGVNYHFYTSLESTNTAAFSHQPLSLLVADEQTGGRGRLGRQWHSPAGLNLYFSLVLCPRLPRQRWGGLSLAAGVALATTLARLGLRPGLKWPNDLVLDGGKAAGILLEAKEEKLVVGVGVNVNQRQFAAGLHASSLVLATGRLWRRDLLLAVLVRELLAVYDQWQRGWGQQIINAWQQYDIVLGRRIAVRRGQQVLVGMAVGVAADGRLILDTGSSRHLLHSGEVSIGTKE